MLDWPAIGAWCALAAPRRASFAIGLDGEDRPPPWSALLRHARVRGLPVQPPRLCIGSAPRVDALRPSAPDRICAARCRRDRGFGRNPAWTRVGGLDQPWLGPPFYRERGDVVWRVSGSDGASFIRCMFLATLS